MGKWIIVYYGTYALQPRECYVLQNSNKIEGQQKSKPETQLETKSDS
jgi:hypothetical protein